MFSVQKLNCSQLVDVQAVLSRLNRYLRSNSAKNVKDGEVPNRDGVRMAGPLTQAVAGASYDGAFGRDAGGIARLVAGLVEGAREQQAKQAAHAMDQALLKLRQDSEAATIANMQHDDALADRTHDENIARDQRDFGFLREKYDAEQRDKAIARDQAWERIKALFQRRDAPSDSDQNRAERETREEAEGLAILNSRNATPVTEAFGQAFQGVRAAHPDWTPGRVAYYAWHGLTAARPDLVPARLNPSTHGRAGNLDFDFGGHAAPDVPPAAAPANAAPRPQPAPPPATPISSSALSALPEHMSSSDVLTAMPVPPAAAAQPASPWLALPPAEQDRVRTALSQTAGTPRGTEMTKRAAAQGMPQEEIDGLTAPMAQRVATTVAVQTLRKQGHTDNDILAMLSKTLPEAVVRFVLAQAPKRLPQ